MLSRLVPSPRSLMFPCCPAARVSNVVAKINDLAALGLQMRVFARGLTESEVEAILDRVACGKSLVRFDREGLPARYDHWRCTLLLDPDIEYDAVVMELAAQYTLLLHNIRTSLPSQHTNL